MPDHARLPPTACGEVLRRIISRRRESARLRIAAAAIIAAVPCVGTIATKPPTLLVWNASASTPRGLYRVYPGDGFRTGDSVIAALAEPYRSLAARRGYVPRGVPLVKEVAAVPGDRICARALTVSVRGKPVALRRAADALGRRLPEWNGCDDLGRGEYLLLGESPWSFDGRYFGVTRRGDIIGRAVLLWRV
jgi:conjugative transfer signal peptidase TraF